MALPLASNGDALKPSSSAYWVSSIMDFHHVFQPYRYFDNGSQCQSSGIRVRGLPDIYRASRKRVVRVSVNGLGSWVNPMRFESPICVARALPHHLFRDEVRTVGA